MNKKGFANIIVIIGIVILAAVAGYFFVNQQAPTPTPTPVPDVPKAGPITVNGEITCLPKEGSIQTLECAVGLKGLDGRHYGLKNLSQHNPEYKFSVIELRVEVSGTFSPEEMRGPGDSKYDVVGIIDVLSIKEIAECDVDPDASGKCPEGCVNYGVPLGCVTQEYYDECSKGNKPCPICLAGNTLIDTPSGLVLVKDLQVGTPIWTTDKAGHRVSGVVTKTSKVPAPSTHQMVHLVLDDGREIFVSPGHPIGDGRNVDNLSVGELLDGGRIITAEEIPYQKDYTYDILPSGATGFYWANGILLDSTLH